MNTFFDEQKTRTLFDATWRKTIFDPQTLHVLSERPLCAVGVLLLGDCWLMHKKSLTFSLEIFLINEKRENNEPQSNFTVEIELLARGVFLGIKNIQGNFGPSLRTERI